MTAHPEFHVPDDPSSEDIAGILDALPAVAHGQRPLPFRSLVKDMSKIIGWWMLDLYANVDR